MTTIDFSKCFFCQIDDTDDLRDPTKSQKILVYTVYQNVVQNIIQLKQLNEYPFEIDFQVFEVGEDGLEQALVKALESNRAVWHKSCRNKIDNQKVKRAKKKADKAIHSSPIKTRRMSLPSDGNSSFTSTSQNCDVGPTADDSMSEELCTICDQPGGKKINFYKAATLGIDNKVRASAETLCDKDLIRKLSSGDMIAIDAHYHLTCLADLYRRSEKIEKNKKKKLDDRSKILQGQAFSDLRDYIESYRDTNTIFNMPELCKLYYSHLVSLGVQEQVHTTRLRESLLAAIPDIKEVRNERDNIVQLAFDCDISKALLQLSNHDYNHEIVILSKAAKILRQHIFRLKNTFSGTFS